MTRTKKQLFQALRIFFLCIVCLIALAPFYVAVCYAFKSKVEIAKTKLAFPTTLYLGNFKEAVGLANYFNSFKNSVIVAAFAILIVVVICSMAAYIITRRNDRFYNTMYYIFQLIILLPFQTIMFPLYRQLYQIHALNSLWGLVLVQAGTFVGYNVFLYNGFAGDDSNGGGIFLCAEIYCCRNDGRCGKIIKTERIRMRYERDTADYGPAERDHGSDGENRLRTYDCIYGRGRRSLLSRENSSAWCGHAKNDERKVIAAFCEIYAGRCGCKRNPMSVVH